MVNEKPVKIDSENIYFEIFKAAPIGLAMADLKCNIVDFNKTFIEPGGYAPDDIKEIKHIPALCYNPEDRKKIMETLSKEGKLNNYAVQFKRKDGSPYDVLLTLRKITVDSKEYIIVIHEDVTEKKRIENELKNHIEELERINRSMIGREIKMAELKKELEELKEKLAS